MSYDFDPEHVVDEGHSPLDEEPRTDADGDTQTEAFYPAWEGPLPRVHDDHPDNDLGDE